MILLNGRGEVIFASYQVLFFCNNALEAEIQAIKIGTSLEWYNLLVIVQSDSLGALSSMQDASLIKSPSRKLVMEINLLMEERAFKHCKIDRSHNRLVHNFVNSARTARSTGCIGLQIFFKVL